MAAGLVFAVHPVHVEVFANSVGQSELLATLFILIATDRYLAWRSPGAGGIASRRRGALVGLYLLAILSKETGYVLPALLLAVELLAVADRPPWRARIREIGPLFALLFLAAAAALLLRGLLFLDLKGEVTQLPLRGYGLGERAVLMLAALPQWVRLLVWPAHLQAHYGPPELPAMARLTPDHAIGIGLLALVSWAVIWSWRRAPLLALGLVWIAIALVPVSNLLTATGVFVAERTLFLPSAGFALAVGWGIAATRRRGTAPMVSAAATAILAVIVGLGLVRSMTRSEAWRTQDEFFARLTRDAPRSYRAQLIAGTYYLGARRFPEAERALGSARNLYQGDPAVYETYGQALRVQRRCAEALPIFEDGLTRHPDAVTLRARLIECALAVGDTARARRVAEDAVRRGQREFLSTLQRLAQP